MAILGVADTNSITSLFAEYNPAFTNLFTAILYSGVSSLEVARNEGLAQYSMLHATSISFKGSGITLKRHNVTKLFSLEDYQRSDIVTITWREDDHFTVRNFHKEWLHQFYDEESDTYYSYNTDADAQAALMKNIHVNLHEGNAKLKLEGVLPQRIPDLDLSWEAPGVITYTLSYYVTSWDWETT
jgi:hypothetical protein